MAPMAVEPPIESPPSLREALGLLAAAHPDEPFRPIAGATDVLVQIAGELAPPPARLLDIWGLDELRGISSHSGALVLGALTTYTDIRRSALCRELAPALVEAAATIGAAQIQNRGTLGGNIANASPAGDTLPILLAMDAAIIVASQRGERTILASSFWPAYRRTAMAGDELIIRVSLPIVPGRDVRFRKVGTRRAQAISKVVLALAWSDEADSSAIGPRLWRDVRVALGSVAPTPIRVRATERVLEGYRPTPERADLAAAALAAEIDPIDDVRSTAEYRRMVAARVLHRLLRDAGGW